MAKREEIPRKLESKTRTYRWTSARGVGVISGDDGVATDVNRPPGDLLPAALGDPLRVVLAWNLQCAPGRVGPGVGTGKALVGASALGRRRAARVIAVIAAVVRPHHGHWVFALYFLLLVGHC